MPPVKVHFWETLPVHGWMMTQAPSLSEAAVKHLPVAMVDESELYDCIKVHTIV